MTPPAETGGAFYSRASAVVARAVVRVAVIAGAAVGVAGGGLPRCSATGDRGRMVACRNGSVIPLLSLRRSECKPLLGMRRYGDRRQKHQ